MATNLPLPPPPLLLPRLAARLHPLHPAAGVARRSWLSGFGFMKQLSPFAGQATIAHLSRSVLAIPSTTVSPACTFTFAGARTVAHGCAARCTDHWPVV
ncbi:hypothetical protein NL676_025434 [Syzygium grande]|nr:hypothetical protein NL676_025434 [Syzygium grande]